MQQLHVQHAHVHVHVHAGHGLHLPTDLRVERLNAYLEVKNSQKYKPLSQATVSE